MSWTERAVYRTLITGLKFPVAAAAACGLWTIGRISFTRGYITGDPLKVSFRDFWLGLGFLTIWLARCVAGVDAVSVERGWTTW